MPLPDGRGAVGWFESPADFFSFFASGSSGGLGGFAVPYVSVPGV